MSDTRSTCSASGCMSVTSGVLTVEAPEGVYHLGVCARHGEKAVRGEWFAFTGDATRYVLGSGGRLPPLHYEPFPA